ILKQMTNKKNKKLNKFLSFFHKSDSSQSQNQYHSNECARKGTTQYSEFDGCKDFLNTNSKNFDFSNCKKINFKTIKSSDHAKDLLYTKRLSEQTSTRVKLFDKYNRSPNLNFDKFLHSKQLMKPFKLFLKTEHSDENIEFWMICETFKKIEDIYEQTKLAHEISHKFIISRSPNEVNIDASTKQTILNRIHKGDIDITLFDAAQFRVQQRFLPINNVSKMMKSTVPPKGKVGKEAKQCMQECASEFISFVTSE
ncbi:hypothetical protein A3Q56_06190, partial [Intoshia linei]